MVVWWTELLQSLGVPHICELDSVASLADGVDQRLVDQVLYLRPREVRGRDRHLLHLLWTQGVLDLLQVPTERLHAAFLGREAHLVDAVDTAGTKQSRVESAGHVPRHHDENAVLGRGLGLHSQNPSHP